MLATIAAAAAMFAATNIDDIVVLTVLFVASAKGRPRTWEIIGGQYLGFITLVGISVLAALGLTLVPDAWVGWLGLVPLLIWMRQIRKVQVVIKLLEVSSNFLGIIFTIGVTQRVI